MLQRQIMYKQLQELQRRQQLQGRNQDYISSKQVSPVHFAPTGTGAPIHETQVDDMHMIQHGEFNLFQGNHSNALYSMGLSPQQFDVSSYTTNNPLGMSAMHSSALPSTFMGRKGNFSSDQIGMPDGSLLPIQVFQEKNYFGQGPFQNFNSDLSSLNYSPQGITAKRDTSVVESDASLDPLEHKILYSTDNQSWESSFGTSSKIGSVGVESTVENPSFKDTSPSIQSGSWSALMQSAVGETSSNDTAVQEGWSGLSFQYPEPSSDNQPSNFIINSEKPQNDWVNFQNVPSPSSEPEQLIEKSSMKCSFPSFQQSGHHYLNQKEEFQSEAFHASGQQSSGSRQLVQTPFHSEVHELKDAYHCSSSNSMSGGIQTTFDQLNQLNIHRYALDSQKMDARENVEPSSAHSFSSSNLHGQNLTARSPSESQGFGFRLGPANSGNPQSYSFFPSLSMGNASVTSLPSHSEKYLIKYQHSAPPIPTQMTAKLPAYSAASSQVNFQPLGASAVSQRVGFPSGIPAPLLDISTQQDLSSPRSNKLASSVFQSPGSASSSLETSSATPYEQPRENCFKNENIVGYEQRLENVSSIHEDASELRALTPLSRNTDAQHSLREQYYSEVDGVASSMMSHASQQPSHQGEQKDDKTYIFPNRDISALGQSLHHQLHHPSGKRFPFKYESIDYQQVARARDLLLSEQKVVQDEAKSELDAALHVGAIFSGENQGWNFSQEAQNDQAEKASSAAYLQRFQQMEILGQDDSQNNFIGSNQASNVAAFQSQISLQMAPSWFKHYGTSKIGEVSSVQPFSGLSIGKLQENNLIMQENQGNASQRSGIWPSQAATFAASKNLSPASLLPSDVTHQYAAVPTTKKRKIVAFDMVPWHKEVNCEALRPPNISMAECEWAQASNRRQEEVTNEAEIFDDVFPVVRAKCRLIFTTQFLQKVFRPAPAGILFEDACLTCEYLPYSTARLALRDACNLNTKLPSDTDDVSIDKLKTSERTTACDFSVAVECLVSRVKKLEDDLSRLDGNLSIASIKVDSQELEKFSTLNRFAKFHIKGHPSTADTALSAVHKTTPQRYVIALPMPKILPEVADCLHL